MYKVKKKMKKIKQNQGITLIALVVTIIVLLILAGVSLNLVSGSDGILGRATKAVSESDKATAKEQVELFVAECMTGYYMDGENGSVQSYIESKLRSGKAIGKYTLTMEQETGTSNKKVVVKDGTNSFLTGSLQSNGSVIWDGTAVATEPITVAPTTYTLTYNAGDGTPSKASDTLEAGDTIIFATATKSGYIFKGWYTAATGGTKIGYTTMPAVDTEIYAQYVEEPAVGKTVSYSPSGSYEFNNSLAQDEGTGTTTLSGADFQITSWKVLELSQDKKTVKLVPSAPTTGTLTLQGYQGYNNAVKLLNDACSGLYDGDGEETKITARSVSMEDIEPLLDTTALGTAKTNSWYDITTAKEPYTEEFSHYPAIYATEEKTTTSGMSSQNSFITTNGKVDGTSAAGTLLSPYSTYYSMDASTFSGALGTKSSLFLSATPSETPKYWVASRCVYATSSYCCFLVRIVDSGGLDAYSLYNSYDRSGDRAYRLFPVVSLSSELLSGDNTNGFSVNL